MQYPVIAACLAAVLLTGTAQAGAVQTSLRPEARAPLAQATLLPARSVAPAVSVRPELRPDALSPAQPVRVSAKQAGFERWIAGFRGRALAQGISARTFDAAFRGARYDDDVVAKDRNQSEFVKPIWEYLDRAVSDSRVKNGKRALRKHRKLLDQIEARYGVEKEVVVAVWGMESAYGTNRGDLPVIGSLATLAYDGRRGRFFEKQLIAALKILQNGDTRPRNMTGSWAGAMGHTQFIPTSYLALAVDFTGDGRRDIWSDNPADALASTANYLAKSGWRKGMPWGVEVQLPRGFDHSLAGKGKNRMPSDWARLGVVGTNGKAVPDYGSAALFLPAGARGAAFLIFRNFTVISRYNNADAYVMGVGHLSDRIAGGPPIKAKWPRGDRDLKFAERKELQRLLTRRGFDTRGVDGKIGPATLAAIQAYQRSIGAVPDGYASLKLLERLR